jgi:hypothetical protein
MACVAWQLLFRERFFDTPLICSGKTHRPMSINKCSINEGSIMTTARASECQ